MEPSDNLPSTSYTEVGQSQMPSKGWRIPMPFPFWSDLDSPGLAWGRSVVASLEVALLVLPVVVDGPGIYRTRAGAQVKIFSISVRGAYRCHGEHDCGTQDRGSVSGRLFPFVDSDHDLVQKL